MNSSDFGFKNPQRQGLTPFVANFLAMLSHKGPGTIQGLPIDIKFPVPVFLVPRFTSDKREFCCALITRLVRGTRYVQVGLRFWRIYFLSGVYDLILSFLYFYKRH